MKQITDKERLDFITEYGSTWSVQWMKNGTKPVRYRMLNEGDPEGGWRTSAREAIGAAMQKGGAE